MGYILTLIWRHLGHSPATRWLACALIGAVASFVHSLMEGPPPGVGFVGSVFLGAGLALLAYAPLEYFGHKRGTTSAGCVKMTGLDFLLMIVYFAVAIIAVGWFAV